MLIRAIGNSQGNSVFVPVKQASRLGVLYKADEDYSEKLIRKLTDWCEKNNLRLMAMGYVDDKELGGVYTPHRFSDYFCNKHLNRLKLPQATEFIRYTGERKDYLLNLYCEPCFPLMGISAFSRDSFRIGPYLPEYSGCFDMMLKSDAKDVLSFTDEVLNYLVTFGNGKI